MRAEGKHTAKSYRLASQVRRELVICKYYLLAVAEEFSGYSLGQTILK